jgi:hypothetical protein
MALTTVRITFNFSLPRAEFEQVCAQAAHHIADDVPGLHWKIWSLDDAAHEFCGLYLFADAGAAHAYVNGPIIAQLKGAPFVSNFSAKPYEVIENLTAITRGPVTAAVAN